MTNGRWLVERRVPRPVPTIVLSAVRSLRVG
jgi:hypothetical protein